MSNKMEGTELSLGEDSIELRGKNCDHGAAYRDGRGKRSRKEGHYYRRVPRHA